MKITCNRAKIADAAGMLLGIAKAGRLDSICLRAADGHLAMEATDLDVGARIRIEAQIDAEGEICVPAGTFAGIVRDLRGEGVELDAEGDQMHIRSQASDFRLLGKPAEDFPGIGDMGLWEADSVSVVGADLASAIERTRMAAARQSVQYAMTGVSISVAGDAIELAATDTHRLAVARCKILDASTEQTGVALLKGVIMLGKMAAKAELVRLRVTDRMLIADGGGWLMMCMLIQGRFPNYQKIIPVAEKCRAARMNAGDFAQAVRQAAHMAGDKEQLVIIRLGSGEATISARDAGGEASIRVPAEHDGDDVSIILAHPILIDALAAIQCDSVTIHYRDSISPILMIEGEYRHMLMPYAPMEATT